MVRPDRRCPERINTALYCKSQTNIGTDLTGSGSLAVNQEMIGSSPIVPAKHLGVLSAVDGRFWKAKADGSIPSTKTKLWCGNPIGDGAGLENRVSAGDSALGVRLYPRTAKHLGDIMYHYFVVNKSTGAIKYVVQRSKDPQPADDVKFVRADGLLLPVYYKLRASKMTVTLQEVLNYLS